MTEVYTFDRRLHPVRPDLADEKFRGIYKAERFVAGVRKRLAADSAPMRPAPRPDQPIDTEILYGETVTVFEETPEGWAWGQNETDGYVGWLSSDDLTDPGVATHRVSALRTYRYPGPDLKFPPLGLISIGAQVFVAGTARTRGLDYVRLPDGSYVVEKHLAPVDTIATDWVAVAEDFIGTPYRWGGRSSLGLDCSALIQLAAQAGGHKLLRDSDMQERTAGSRITFDGDLSRLQRGDLVFWKGHVGVVAGPNRLLHANGHTMTVACEPLDKAVSRIAESEFGAITKVRRL
ncbi:NlpC/P60 family protein [Roseibium sp. RKSG952]|uniref:C40 family peptidase n=1 Tax=Roseibium sp. RKSG952 TaxID=2529384 RepID=UPI0012BD70B9|nr:NlpC/P60 family protein [Roseibium sp. RKSG952]MTH97070.1 glycoside hydrolase [Roseibium sp. RKSG952]